MKNYKILYDEPGQSCNRFWSYIASISWALDNNGIVYVLFWDTNFKFFNRLLLKNGVIKFPFYHEKLWGFHVKSFYPYRFIFSWTIGHPFIRKKYKEWYNQGEKFHFVSGWKTRGCGSYIKHIDVFKQIFSPNDDIVKYVDSLFNDFYKTYDFIIGIHIRRGDYKEYREGKYYYSYEEYKEKMEELLNLYGKKNRVCFYIASNENVPLDVFKGMNIIYIPGASMAVDLYALSKCDRLVGPSSTFTRWVSFLERIPLYYIFDIHKKIDSDNLFSPIFDFYHFENGEVLPF